MPRLTGSAFNADQLDGLDSTAFALLAGRAGGQTLTGGTGASENLVLRSTSHATKGSIRFDDQVQLATGSVSVPSLAFAADTDTGFYSIADGNIGIAIQGTEAWQISSFGPALMLSRNIAAGFGTNRTTTGAGFGAFLFGGGGVTTGAGGDATVRGGDAAGAVANKGGDVFLEPGDSVAGGAQGIVVVRNQNNNRTADFVPRVDNEGNIGTAARTWTNAFIRTITGSDDVSGNLALVSTTSASKGFITFDAVWRVNATGGSFFESVDSNGTIRPVRTTAGAGFALALIGGTAVTSGAGANVSIQGGAAAGTNQNGGSVILRYGTHTGSGTEGDLKIRDSAGTNMAIFDAAPSVNNRTPMQLLERTAGVNTMRRVEWFDPGAAGINLMAGQKLLVLV
jgi:hypothetical protein